VRTIRNASEAEVLECFWQGEIAESSRWNAAEVEERERTWRERVGLFAGFPDDVEWELVTLTRDEVLAIRYINWDWWLKVTKGTGSQPSPRKSRDGTKATGRSRPPPRRIQN
jgi:hypothetical protein